MNTFMRSALAAGVVVTATLTLNLVILDANHLDMLAIAELPEIRGELHYDASSDIFDLPNDLVTAYMRCSKAATQRMLARAEASNCASTYLRLKLSFLPDVTL